MEVFYAVSKFNNRKRSSKIEVIKALNVLGFTTWNELQSGTKQMQFQGYLKIHQQSLIGVNSCLSCKVEINYVKFKKY